MNIILKQALSPELDHSGKPILLSDHTIKFRKQKVLNLMQEANLSSLVVYADKEHGSNFEYLTGFIPRFEEGLQILNQDGSSTLVLGNENYNKVKFSRVESEGVHCPLFSLPNQPMGDFRPLTDYLRQVNFDTSQKVGVVGWKLLSNDFNDFHQNFDLPAFIIDALAEVAGKEKLVNATQIYMHPGRGARVTNNANEIAHYEYGASLASDAVLSALNELEEGVSETEIGNLLTRDGQYQNVVTISAFGERFIKANLYPTNRQLKKGDKVALTVSYKGGLSSRSGYAVSNREELESVDSGYLEEVVIPYFKAYNWWLQNIMIGIRGSDFYDRFAEYYPQDKYGWELCPGHLTADEEWLSSPFYKGSDAIVQSGNIFQVDFIPVQEGHNGVSAESTIALADNVLIQEIQTEYPELWERIESRRNYLKENLNIHLKPEVLPLASTLGYYRPFFLNSEIVLAIE
ncbi:Xaa-Pro aminopeptidase [Bacillus sp. FJAT-27225]|uniref:M24 family metallopeptidase n=1 Tax=Bacillus sp. FJAT-27225 TaxID=1743144 RepID=UPI00080C2BF4|nr:aminopeptidase P family N-terminal domain-containing protein [Bacillus sp. FJAT-27225]OCA83146.1 Xaa-Pro aminopeptidase [Bacillus sp. FJAT-27225]